MSIAEKLEYARKEIAQLSKPQIDARQAEGWAARSVAALENYNSAQNGEDASSWYALAIECRQTAVFFAGMAGPDFLASLMGEFEQLTGGGQESGAGQQEPAHPQNGQAPGPHPQQTDMMARMSDTGQRGRPAHVDPVTGAPLTGVHGARGDFAVPPTGREMRG
jgi:hypothetical protein